MHHHKFDREYGGNIGSTADPVSTLGSPHTIPVNTMLYFYQRSLSSQSVTDGYHAARFAADKFAEGSQNLCMHFSDSIDNEGTMPSINASPLGSAIVE